MKDDGRGHKIPGPSVAAGAVTRMRIGTDGMVACRSPTHTARRWYGTPVKDPDPPPHPLVIEPQ